MPGGAIVVAADEVVTCDLAVAPNQPPVAVDDSLSVPSRDPACIDVLANDHDPEGTSVSLLIGMPPGHLGSIVSRVGDSLCYQPGGDFWGPDSFTYTIADAGGAVATATVHVDVARYCNPAFTSGEVVVRSW